MYHTLTNALGCVTMYLKKGDMERKMKGRKLTDIESTWTEILEDDEVIDAINQVSYIYAVSSEDIARALKCTYLGFKMFENNYRKMHGLPMRRKLTKTKRLPKRIKRKRHKKRRYI